MSAIAGGPKSRLRLIRSVLRASNFPCLKFIEIVICGFITPSLLALPCFGTFGHKFLTYFLWLRNTDEGSVPEMRIWSISLIKSVLNGVNILVEVSF